jgi:hypothetical protein|tara:strand:- start:293 stop:844 length:552 start_codon:yes stop_codon:yes gene_type:complete
MKKWIGFSLGALVGLSHIGMIGMIANRSKFPKLNLPVSDYTSYSVIANEEGYTINYRAHDPRVLIKNEGIERPAGFLGMGKTKVSKHEQYYISPSGTKVGGTKLDDKVACIKAQGSGEGTGRMVGGAAAAATVTHTGIASVPIIGWVLAGAATMIGMDQGAEIGGNMAKDLSKDCEEVEEDIK